MGWLNFSDHALTTIGTWAEVAILLFMLYEHYGCGLWARLMGRHTTAPAAAPPSSIWRSIWANRTLIVALVGLAIVIWLNFSHGRSTNSGDDEWLSGRKAVEQFVPRDFASDQQKAANNLTQQLRDGLLIARGVPHYGAAGDPAVVITAGEWQMLHVGGSDFQIAGASNGPQHSYDALEIRKSGSTADQEPTDDR